MSNQVRFWRLAVEEQSASGLSIRQFFQHEDLGEASFYAWRRTLRQRDAQSASDPPAFVPAVVGPIWEELSSEEQEDSMAPAVVAEVKSHPVEGRVLLVDGFTITAADTPENQAEYPQNPKQADGLGFPILRCLTLVSMVSGMLFDLACGPYSGKESGETALLRQLLNVLRADRGIN